MPFFSKCRFCWNYYYRSRLHRRGTLIANAAGVPLGNLHQVAAHHSGGGDEYNPYNRYARGNGKSVDRETTRSNAGTVSYTILVQASFELGKGFRTLMMNRSVVIRDGSLRSRLVRVLPQAARYRIAVGCVAGGTSPFTAWTVSWAICWRYSTSLGFSSFGTKLLPSTPLSNRNS